MSVRRLMRETIEGARDELRKFDETALAPQDLSEEEVLRRYVNHHRGRPGAMVTFARRQAPPGADPLAEAVRYEEKMEKLLRRRHGSD